MLTSAQKKTADKLFGQLQEIASEVRELANAKREQFDNRSEKWQEGDKGQEFGDQLGTLESLADELESAVGTWGDLEMGD